MKIFDVPVNLRSDCYVVLGRNSLFKFFVLIVLVDSKINFFVLFKYFQFKMTEIRNVASSQNIFSIVDFQTEFDFLSVWIHLKITVLVCFYF